ncbi:MAG: transporter substrate-binding domain-containing protein [Snowella sp.]
MLSKTFLKISAIAGIGVITTASMVNSQTKELTGTLKKIKDSGVIVLGVRESSIPFSYLDDQQKPIGYSIDLCNKVVDSIKKQLKLSKLEVKTRTRRSPS